MVGEIKAKALPRFPLYFKAIFLWSDKGAEDGAAVESPTWAIKALLKYSLRMTLAFVDNLTRIL